MSSRTVATPCDVASLERDAAVLRRTFAAAQPFSHLVVDDFLNVEPTAVEEFPGPDWPAWTSLGDNYQLHKRACDDLSVIPEPFASVIRQLSEPRFLRVLEEITGIDRLIPDPYLSGGGLHLSGPGGVLAPHTDFHHYRRLDLYRRLNVLIYLNESWTEDDGGCLSMYVDNVAVRTVVPEFGRMVVFATDDSSVHGFPEPVAAGKWRRSVALYYYTAGESDRFSGDATTYWRQHPAQRGALRRLRFRAYRALLNLSRTISVIAHLVNPEQGAGLVRTIIQNRRQAAKRQAGDGTP